MVVCLGIWALFCRAMTGEWSSAVKGALLAGGSMLIFYIVFRRGIGAGDVKLLTVVGFYMGGERIWELLFVIFLTAAVWGIWLHIIKKNQIKTIPLAVCVLLGVIFHMGNIF